VLLFVAVPFMAANLEPGNRFGLMRDENQEEKLLRSLKSQPIVSGVLVAANAVIFILCTFSGIPLYETGRLDVFHVLTQREYGRIIWAMFLHADISHLANNMIILFFLGEMIEKEVGHVRYALVYFLSGIGGNLLSLLVKVLTNDISASLGASGAIFGLDGALLAMVFFWDRKMENVTPVRVLLMIIYSLYSGFRGVNIDNAAHVGGLFTGFCVTGIICFLERIKRRRRTREQEKECEVWL